MGYEMMHFILLTSIHKQIHTNLTCGIDTSRDTVMKTICFLILTYFGLDLVTPVPEFFQFPFN